MLSQREAGSRRDYFFPVLALGDLVALPVLALVDFVEVVLAAVAAAGFFVVVFVVLAAMVLTPFAGTGSLFRKCVRSQWHP